ncbi:hypothetical protein Gotri_012127, partial [Gossypium trilobum]|nr:hypothetical protein [Gossypium trilobum]
MEPFVYDVNFAGAIGDGESDDTEAFKNAWNIVCSSHISSGVFRVPYGQKFLLQPLTFNGECRPKNITFQIDGILIAPSDPSSWKCNDTNCNNWITFQHFDGLIVQGIGSLHGKWGFAILDSKNVHISLWTVENGIFQLKDLHPFMLLNSISKLQKIALTLMASSIIKTGDDCIAIGDGSKYININRIFCGPGHGISIGSLGENGRRETVEYTTENGLRIKIWQSIDVEISNILYNDLRGTINGEIAVELSC